MSTENNKYPENTQKDSDSIGFSPVQTNKKPRRKRSLFKSQIFTLIAIATLIIALAVGVGIAINRFAGGDEIIDSFTESFTSKENGKVSYTYYSKNTANGFVITDADGKTIDNYFVDESGNVVEAAKEGTSHVFQTEIGSMLTLTATGKITYYARVDHNGEYVGGDTSAKVLVFPRAKPEKIAEIFVHNVDKDGVVTEFTVIGSDTDGNKSNDYFYLKGYENATINKLISSTMCSFAGYTLTSKKLSIDFMEDYDEDHKNEAGYIPLVGADGKINFSEYGLDSDNYYELTTTDGDKHRLYIGNAVPDGSGLYVRYQSESEGDRNAVYILSDDSGMSAITGKLLSRSKIFLGKPETLIAPQIGLPTTLNTYLLVEDFIISKRQPDGSYKNITDFSYIDLSLRNYTLSQYHPYIINDPDILSGYILNDSLLDAALIDMYDISTLMNASYSSTAVENYVTVRKLVKNIFPETLPSYYDDMVAEIIASSEKAAKEDAELRATLEKYGLAEPENKLFYTPMSFGSTGMATTDGMPTYIWVSGLTEQKTYYVWAPIYQQILEIGASYLDMFTYDEYDWASTTVFDANISFCDSIRVTGDDKDGNYKDILFELIHEYDLTFKWNYSFTSATPPVSTLSGSEYVMEVTVTEDGEYLLTLSSNVDYVVQYKNTQTGEIVDDTETHSIEFFSKLSSDTVKNYAKYFLDQSTLGSLSSEEVEAVRNFANSVGQITEQSDGTVKISYTGKDKGVPVAENPNYYYVPSTNYVTVYIYDPDTDVLTVSVNQAGSGVSAVVFEEDVFADLVEKIVTNDGEATLTDEELANVNSLYKRLENKTSTQTRLKITSFDKDGNVKETKTYVYDKNDRTAEGSVFMEAFKSYYKTLLYATYKGRVTETDTVGGKVLTEEQMAEYREKGDDCDLKIDIRLGIDGKGYTFRMYNYSVTRSYITSNGNGIFYLDRNRVEKLLADAIKASLGDTNIDSTTTY